MLPADEVREWQKFLMLTSEILPCDHCRDHYHKYSVAHPLTQIKTMSKEDMKIFIKKWIWTLHNEVNMRNQKPIFEFENLETYNSVNLQDQLWRLDPIMKRAIQLSGVSLLKWTAWLHSYKMLLSLIS